MQITSYLDLKTEGAYISLSGMYKFVDDCSQPCHGTSLMTVANCPRGHRVEVIVLFPVGGLVELTKGNVGARIVSATVTVPILDPSGESPAS